MLRYFLCLSTFLYYAKGMTTRDIHDHLNQLYGIDISPSYTLLEEEPIYKEGITPDIAGRIAASGQLFDTVRLAEKRFPKNKRLLDRFVQTAFWE